MGVAQACLKLRVEFRKRLLLKLYKRLLNSRLLMYCMMQWIEQLSLHMNELMKSCIEHVSSWKLFRALHIRKTKSITASGHQTLVETGEFLTTF